MMLNLTKREVSVVREVLAAVSAYTEQEARDQFDWTADDLRAWSSALAKVGAAS